MEIEGEQVKRVCKMVGVATEAAAKTAQLAVQLERQGSKKAGVDDLTFKKHDKVVHAMNKIEILIANIILNAFMTDEEEMDSCLDYFSEQLTDCVDLWNMRLQAVTKSLKHQAKVSEVKNCGSHDCLICSNE